MQKDIIRDYATEAFRYYAACGKISAEDIKAQIYKTIAEEGKKEKEINIKGNGYTDLTALKAMKADDEMMRLKAQFEDIIAVEKTLSRLTSDEKKAVDIVYFTNAKQPLRRGEISNRVHKAETELFISERNIYYMLKRVRTIFAYERGLRID